MPLMGIKMKLTLPPRSSAGYAMLMVLTVVAASMLIAGATIYRTYTVAKLNDRNNQYAATLTAAEAAVEKVYARLAYDFQSAGPGAVTNNLGIYRTNVPSASEDAYWAGFEFTDGSNHVDRTYVNYAYNYGGPLPSQYQGLIIMNSPVYRILSNAKLRDGRYTMTNAVQVDVLLALVPITQWAIFYNGLLEFSTCADMVVNGRVHANASIYVGTGASLRFNNSVTTTGTLTAPARNGQGPWTLGGSANTTFFGSPTYKTNVPSVTLSINMTNTHSMIDMPPTGEVATSPQGQQRLYNQAQVVLLVSNSTASVPITVKIQQSVNGQIPGADPSPIILTNNFSTISSNLPFLTLTNTFRDQRESKTNITTQIDVGKYATWLSASPDIATKFTSASGTYPTILFVADNRTTSANQMTVVRLTNGIAPPKNGNLGFSLATPNPLYVWGNYNQTNNSYLSTSNTTSGTVPCALMSDALTILSSNWKDKLSLTNTYSQASSSWDAASATTVNAAILTGVVPSTGSGSTQFSGGVHNLPRLLEDWSSSTLWLNTSIVNLYTSTRATSMFQTPGVYYNAPTRRFSFDLNFLDPNKQPQGVPCALLPIRFSFAVPPPNTVSFNVTP